MKGQQGALPTSLLPGRPPGFAQVAEPHPALRVAVFDDPRAVVVPVLEQHVRGAVAVEVAAADDRESLRQGVEVRPRHRAVALREPAPRETRVVFHYAVGKTNIFRDGF